MMYGRKNHLKGDKICLINGQKKLKKDHDHPDVDGNCRDVFFVFNLWIHTDENRHQTDHEAKQVYEYCTGFIIQTEHPLSFILGDNDSIGSCSLFDSFLI